MRRGRSASTSRASAAGAASAGAARSRCRKASSPSTASPRRRTTSRPSPRPRRATSRIRGELENQRRLSCSATIQGDLVVDVPQDVQINRQIVRKRAETRVIERDPITQLCYVEVDEPDMHKPLGDTDRLLRVLAKEWRFEGLRIDFDLLPKVQKILREGEWKVTAAVHHDRSGPVVIALWPGLHNFACGIAVDIGSTTIACHLSALLSGRTLASAGIPESADPLRRGSDEPRLLRDDESGRARGDDQGGARGDRRADRKSLRRGGRLLRRDHRVRLRRQSDHASPLPRHRSDRARRRALRARRLRRAEFPRPRHRPAGERGRARLHPPLHRRPCRRRRRRRDAFRGPASRRGDHAPRRRRHQRRDRSGQQGPAGRRLLSDRPGLRGRRDFRRPARRAGRHRARPDRSGHARAEGEGDRRRPLVGRAGIRRDRGRCRRHRHLRLRHHRGDRRDVSGRHRSARTA